MKYEICQSSYFIKWSAIMPSSPMSTLRALAAVALLPALAACQDQAISAIAKPERPVQVQRVKFQSEDATGEFVGVVRARLDPKDLQLKVASAEAEISAATSNFAQAGSDEKRFAELKARGFAAVAD